MRRLWRMSEIILDDIVDGCEICAMNLEEIEGE
jgi:hypothetical protein